MALTFLSLFGLFIGVLLSEALANFKMTPVVKAHDSKLYAADAGIDYGVQALIKDPTQCPITGSTHTWTLSNVNGENVQVTCTVLSGDNGQGPGSQFGPSGWTAVATGTAPRPRSREVPSPTVAA